MSCPWKQIWAALARLNNLIYPKLCSWWAIFCSGAKSAIGHDHFSIIHPPNTCRIIKRRRYKIMPVWFYQKIANSQNTLRLPGRNVGSALRTLVPYKTIRAHIDTATLHLTLSPQHIVLFLLPWFWRNVGSSSRWHHVQVLPVLQAGYPRCKDNMPRYCRVAFGLDTNLAAIVT